MESSILNLRLASQQLINATFTHPKEVASWMGGMQAQDFNMAKWAIGIRIPGCTNKMVEDAFNIGEILRTHVMRPTWHFVAPEDIRWMLLLSKEKIKSSMKSRDADLGLTEKIIAQSKEIIQKALHGNKHLTREELTAALEDGKMHADSSRIYHYLMHAELDGIICSGALHGKEQTYALIEERVPQTQTFSKEEALAKLAKRYFASHGPATLQDFVWWSGLSTLEAKKGLEIIQPDCISEKIDSQTYWLVPSPREIPESSNFIHLLPAFDEFIISYRDRKAILSSENHSKAISSNGIFRPVIVHNGHAVGLWKKTSGKNKIVITPDYFQPIDGEIIDLMKEPFKRVETFFA